jgi:branched-subunit amino acid aminotransferase/4-amino-4-deoxychorismate lyase
LNYFLADREANLQGSRAAYPGAILSDASGNLQDTSTANLIVVHQGRLICAPQKSVLHGISIQTTIQLAKAAGWSVDEQPLSAELIRSADEILLVGSIGCIWSSCQVDQQDFPGPGGTALQQLSQAWKHRVACDFIDQALAAADESTQEGR